MAAAGFPRPPPEQDLAWKASEGLEGPHIAQLGRGLEPVSWQELQSWVSGCQGSAPRSVVAAVVPEQQAELGVLLLVDHDPALACAARSIHVVLVCQIPWEAQAAEPTCIAEAALHRSAQRARTEFCIPLRQAK
eukprot:670859-Alexandrium_andersonii.AAC.1